MLLCSAHAAAQIANVQSSDQYLANCLRGAAAQAPSYADRHWEGDASNLRTHLDIDVLSCHESWQQCWDEIKKRIVTPYAGTMWPPEIGLDEMDSDLRTMRSKEAKLQPNDAKECETIPKCSARDPDWANPDDMDAMHLYFAGCSTGRQQCIAATQHLINELNCAYAEDQCVWHYAGLEYLQGKCQSQYQRMKAQEEDQAKERAEREAQQAQEQQQQQALQERQQQQFARQRQQQASDQKAREEAATKAYQNATTTFQREIAADAGTASGATGSTAEGSDGSDATRSATSPSEGPEISADVSSSSAQPLTRVASADQAPTTQNNMNSDAVGLAQGLIGAATTDVGHGRETGEVRLLEVGGGSYPGEGGRFDVGLAHLRYGLWSDTRDAHHPIGPELEGQVAIEIAFDASTDEFGDKTAAVGLPLAFGGNYYTAATHGWLGVGAQVGGDPLLGNAWLSAKALVDLYRDAAGGALIYADARFQSKYDNTLTFGGDFALNLLVLQGGVVLDPTTGATGVFGGIGFRIPIGAEVGRGEDVSASNDAATSNGRSEDDNTGADTSGESNASTRSMQQQSDRASTSPISTAPKTLFERLGGQPGINAVVHDFLGNVLADPKINQRFTQTNMPHLEKMLDEFMCAATGGGCTYEGRNMESVHHGMQIVDAEYDAVVADLTASLAKFKVPDKEQDELLGALAALKPQIVVNPDQLHPIDINQLAKVTKLASTLTDKRAQALLAMAVIAGKRGQRDYAATLFTHAESIVGAAELATIAGVFRSGDSDSQPSQAAPAKKAVLASTRSSTDQAGPSAPQRVETKRVGPGSQAERRPIVARPALQAEAVHSDKKIARKDQPFAPGVAQDLGAHRVRRNRAPLLFGAGALALLGTGAGFMIWGEATYGDAKAEKLDQERRDSLYNSANSRFQIGQGLGVGGLVCVGMALWEYFHGRHQQSSATAFQQVVLSPRGIALIGTF